jgi:nitrate/nitrite-specific signal transduction histidine kinase
VRQLSRSLLPIQLLETNIEAALGEMVAYFSEFSTASIHLRCHGNSTNIPTPTAQHLYRITHEAIYRAVYKHKAADVDIKLITGTHNFRTVIIGSGTPRHTPLAPDLVSAVMKYRIRTMGGQQTFTVLKGGGFKLECSTMFREEIE